MAKLTRRDFIRVALATTGVSAIMAGCQTAAPAAQPTTAAKPAATQAAAGTPAPATQAPATKANVTIRAMVYPYPPTAAIREQLPEYKNQTGVTVEWEDVPYAELLSKQMAELIAKSDRYDLFVLSNKFVGPEAGTGQLAPIDDMAAKAGAALNWDDFLGPQKGMFVYKGQAYGIPMSSNTQLCAYRQDLIDQYGIKIPPPETSFTRDEWLKVVQELDGKEGLKGTSMLTQPMQVPSENSMHVWMSAGLRMFDEKLNPTFNTQGHVDGALWLQELMKYSPADVLRYTNVETNEAMQRGDVITQTMQWVSRIPMVEDKEKSKVVGKVRWTTLPYVGIDPSIKVGRCANDAWGFVIPNASKNKQVAFDFATWCVTPDKQENLVVKNQVAPTRASVFDKPALHQQFAWLPVMKIGLNNAYDFPIIPEWSEILEKVGAEIHGAWSGQQSMQQALDRSNDQVTTLLKERNYPVGTWTGDKLPWE